MGTDFCFAFHFSPIAIIINCGKVWFDCSCSSSLLNVHVTVNDGQAVHDFRSADTKGFDFVSFTEHAYTVSQFTFVVK